MSSALARSRKTKVAQELICEHVYRPLAHLVVLVLLPLRVPPPLVAATAGATGIAAAVQLAQGRLLLAAILIQAKTVLDNADGQLARLSGRITAFGRYLDSELDLFVNAALFAGVAVATGRPGVGRRRLPRADDRAERQLQRRAALPRRARRGRDGDAGDDRARGGLPARALPARLRAAGSTRRAFRRAPAARRRPARSASPTTTAPRFRCWRTSGCRRSSSSSAPASRSAGPLRSPGSRSSELALVLLLALRRELVIRAPARHGGVGVTSVVELISRPEEPEPRAIAPEDWRRYESYVGEIFTALGMDLAAPGTRETPRRFLQALRDATAGYDGDPKLRTAFPSERPPRRRRLAQPDHRRADRLPRPVRAPRASVPRRRTRRVRRRAEIIGISKLTRLVRLYARRFTVQERVGEQIADLLDELVQPRGVAVRLEAAHLCTQMRGVAEEGSRTVTTFWRGLYDERAELRASSSPRSGAAADDRSSSSSKQARAAELDLPEELRGLYGGGLGFDEPCLFANFVETIDGVVAIPDDALERADRGRERGRPLRDGASTRVCGRGSRWLRDDACVPGRDVAA